MLGGVGIEDDHNTMLSVGVPTYSRASEERRDLACYLGLGSLEPDLRWLHCL